MKKKRIKRADILLILSLLLMALVLWLLFGWLGGKEGARAVITVDGELYGEYPLDKEQKIQVMIGDRVGNVLSIQDGKADMVEADCPDKLCVHQRAISKAKESIVCLPHKVVVTVEQGTQEASSIDSMAR